MKTTLSLLCLAALMASPASSFAQRSGGPGGGTGGQSGAPSGGSGGGDQSDGNMSYSPAAVAERFLNNDNLRLNGLENGSFEWRGYTFNLADNRLVRARFERYLDLPDDSNSTEKYDDVIGKINDLLSVQQGDTNQDQKVYQAWQLLFDAGKYDEDGGQSLVIADQVYNAWRARQEEKDNDQQRDELDNVRKEQEDTVADRTDTDIFHQIQASEGTSMYGPVPPPSTNNSGVSGGGGGGSGGGGTGGGGTGGTGGGRGGRGANNSGNSASASSNGTGNVSTNNFPGTSNNVNLPDLPSIPGMPNMPSLPNVPQHPTDEFFRWMDLLRTNSEETALDAKSMSVGLMAKLQFQTTIVGLMLDRRFEHSVIAGAFYRHIFKSSAQKIDVGDGELKKFADLRDVMPTTDSLEFVAREAMNDSSSGMKAVEVAYDSGERWAALERLQETFLLGEYMSEVQQFDSAKRKVLFGLYHNARDLQRLMDLHDYAAVDDTLDKIEAVASDFPSAGVRSAVRTAEQASDLALLSAKQALLTNNTDDAKTYIEQAITLWPLNPNIKSFSKNIADRVDITVTLAPQFDDLIKRQDYRQIYDRRSEFGLAFIQDDARAAQLKDIVERLGKIDMMVGYANAAVQQNNGYAAWELLESAAQLDSTDPVLANARADIAPRVADFAQALDSAQRAAKDGNYATSLNYYLAAQDIYPASQISHDGIELVSKQLMAKLNPDGPTAHALAEDQAKADAAAAAAAAANAASTPAPVHAAVPTTSPSSTTDTSDANADSATTTTNSASNQGDESAVRDTSSTAMTENTGVTKRDLSDSTKGSGVPNTLF